MDILAAAQEHWRNPLPSLRRETSLSESPFFSLGIAILVFCVDEED